MISGTAGHQQSLSPGTWVRITRNSRILGGMTGTGKHRKVLFIGAHGKVGLLALPKLVEEGHEVTGLIRSSEYAADLVALGVIPLVQDVTELDAAEWERLLADFDAVVWAAGAGGGAAPETIMAVDRDAALASVNAALRLGRQAPRYLLVSFLGSLTYEVEPNAPLYNYVQAKRAVDEHLLASTGLDYLILAPGPLTMDRARGITVISNDAAATENAGTARDLVADVIVELIHREQLPADRVLAFRDGDMPVQDL